MENISPPMNFIESLSADLVIQNRKDGYMCIKGAIGLTVSLTE